MISEKESKIRVKAQQSQAVFNDFVMKDGDGESIKSDIIHQVWNAHIDFSWKHNLSPWIIAPPGHGKSTQITLARPLRHIGLNKKLRIKIICNYYAR